MTVYRFQGKWRYHFIRNAIRHTRAGFDSKQEARIAEADARRQVERINTDFIGLCEARLRDLELRRGVQHFKENKALFEKLVGRWGTGKAITRRMVTSYLDEVAETSRSKANKQLRLIRALFNHGLQENLVAENPAAGIRPYPSQGSRRYVPPIEDVDAVMAVAKPPQRLYLTLIQHTVARVREINRLTWDDVHDDYVVLRTRKAKNSDLTERRIPLTPTAKTVLAEIPRTSEHVFTNPRTGRGYDYRKKLMRSLCQKAGVRYFSFHAFRHLGASILSKEGVPLTDIQRVLGHQRATTTDIYLRSIGDLSDAMRKLERQG